MFTAQTQSRITSLSHRDAVCTHRCRQLFGCCERLVDALPCGKISWLVAIGRPQSIASSATLHYWVYVYVGPQCCHRADRLRFITLIILIKHAMHPRILLAPYYTASNTDMPCVAQTISRIRNFLWAIHRHCLLQITICPIMGSFRSLSCLPFSSSPNRIWVCTSPL